MQRSIIFLSIFLAIAISPSLCLGKQNVDKKNFIALRKNLLSIDAHNISPEHILKELGEVCGIKIVVNSDPFPDTPVSIKFKDLQLVEGVKKILKVTGVQNYIVQYQKVGNSNYISRIEFLSSKSESQIFTPGRKMELRQTKLAPKTPKKKSTTTSSVVHPEKDIEDKIDSLEKQFEWDDDRTAELAKEILRGAPPNVRSYALESIKKLIQNYLKEEDSSLVNKEMIYKSTVEAVPPDMQEMKDKVIEYLDSLDKE